ncbi:IS1380 family transposase [Actinomadura latina]|uniref:IS1380 family transposase n=1 Tax=Actinomadura latina TaxID=163603 RepID=A0A846YZC9_9ACTN|nr:IS1380 family transposase [Actinomadura latina]
MAVDVAGGGVVNHTGSAALRLIADGLGLTGELSRALARPGREVVHDRGRVLADTAVMIADGGRVLGHLATLRDQHELYGEVASDSTLWRTLNEIGPLQRDRVAAARKKIRAKVWKLIAARHGGIPPSRVAGTDLGRQVVIRLDATLVIAHSDKEKAAGTFKGTYGHHPLTSWCDNTAENLVTLLRPGNAGSNTAADHIAVLDASIEQIPRPHRRNLLVTIDGAGASHALIDHLHATGARPGRRLEYSAGWDLGEREKTAITQVPETAWQSVLDRHGDARDDDDAGVVELTGLLRHSAAGDQLATWPKPLRIICRRERPSSGAQLSLLEEADGWRYQLHATNSAHRDIQFLEARHRPQARVEDRIRCAKATGLGHMPSNSFTINQAWCDAAAIACDLLRWLQLLCLTGDLAKAEPATLRYQILHTAARITRGQRKRKIRVPATWPWARQLAACLEFGLALNPSG